MLHHKRAIKASSRSKPFLRSMPSILKAAARSAGSAQEIFDSIRQEENQANYKLRNAKAIQNARASMKISGGMRKSSGQCARREDDDDDDDDDDDEDFEAVMREAEVSSDVDCAEHESEKAANDGGVDNAEDDTFDLGSGAFDDCGAEPYHLTDPLGDVLY